MLQRCSQWCMPQHVGIGTEGCGATIASMPVECWHAEGCAQIDAVMPSRQLYEVLAAKGVAGRRLPVLLVANKADQGAKAHTPDFVRRRLEREL